MSGDWVYKQTEDRLWTVGHYDGDGTFQPESDHGSPAEAAEHIRHLNGGPPAASALAGLPELLRRELATVSLGLAALMKHHGLPEVTESDVDAALAERGMT